MVSLTNAVALRNNDTVGTLYRTAHVGLQLRAVYLTILVDGVNLAVIIEEYREVVDISLHVVMRPRSSDILGGVALQALTVDVRKDIELPVSIADGWCPDALTVYLLMILQGKLVIRKVETVKTIRDILPVYKVLGVQDDQTWHRMHRRSCKIVVVAHTDDIWVGKLIVEQGVGKRAITIVSRPRRLRTCRGQMSNE